MWLAMLPRAPVSLAAGEPFALEVGAKGFVDYRGVGAHGVVQGQDRLQDFVVDVDEGEGLLGDVGADGGDGGDGVALVEGFLMGHYVFGHEADVALGFGQVDDLILDDGEVLGGDYGQDAGQGFGAGGVDAADAGVGVGAAEDFAVDHSGKLDVGAVFGGAGDLGRCRPWRMGRVPTTL